MPVKKVSLSQRKLWAEKSPWLLNLDSERLAAAEVARLGIYSLGQSYQDSQRPYVPRPIAELSQLPGHESLVGFIYRITDRVTGKFYVGQKTLGLATKRKATVKEKAAALALNARSRISIIRGRKPSDWLAYWGSCEDLLVDVETHGPERFVREIIDLCCSKKYLLWSELEQIIKHDCLRKDSSQCYNGHVLGSYYRRDVQNCPEPEN